MNSVINKTKKNSASKKSMKKDFDGKISFGKRLAMKLFSFEFIKNLVVKIFAYVFLVGISYIIIYPFITKISASFMSADDFADATVKLIPKYPTLDTYRYIIIENEYFKGLINTAALSLAVAFIQTLVSAFVGYGLAKFKFKGKSLVFALVVLTMVVPHKTLQLSMYMKFKYFDIYGIIEALGLKTIDMIDTVAPLIILSIFALAFKNGLYIFIFRQFYKGVPDELEEAAYIDGTGIFKTYFRIILPLSIPMMTTIFMFAFSWQWTDKYYSDLFFPGPQSPHFLSKIIAIPESLTNIVETAPLQSSAVLNTCGLLVILPLFIIFLFTQRSLVQGIERSGIVG